MQSLYEIARVTLCSGMPCVRDLSSCFAIWSQPKSMVWRQQPLRFQLSSVLPLIYLSTLNTCPVLPDHSYIMVQSGLVTRPVNEAGETCHMLSLIFPKTLLYWACNSWARRASHHSLFPWQGPWPFVSWTSAEQQDGTALLEIVLGKRPLTQRFTPQHAEWSLPKI